jgi:ABC-type spermidine/putrescine transport system permease subunit II
VLGTVTWTYIAWSLLPVVAAVVGSLHPESTSMLGLDAYRFALRGEETRQAFFQSVRLAVLTVVIAVPLGTSLGLALAHLRRGAWRVLELALFVLIAFPHAVLAVMLFYVFVFLIPSRFTTPTQLLGHVTIALPFVALIVLVRLWYVDPVYEEQAADLGAPPLSAITRVLVPLCVPAIVVAATVAFTLSFNEIPISAYLCIPNECRTVPVMLSGRAIGTVPPPALAISALATVISLGTLVIAILTVRWLRWRSPAIAR